MEKISSPSLDRFGGLESVHFESTGFFRLEKADRWWLVTPDGSAFLSFGLNHPHPEYMLQEYNKEFWLTKFGARDPSDPAFRSGFIEKVMKDLDLFGMNTIGCHAPKEVFGKITVPYLQGLFFARTAYWLSPKPRDYPDVFSAAFKTRCERVVQKVVLPRKDDPFLMGYTFTNVPILTDLDAVAHGEVPWARSQPLMPTWPRSLRNRGANTPAKREFVALMRKRYPTIKSFNGVYKTSFSSFDELLDAENWSSARKDDGIDDTADNVAFLVKIMEQYYKVTCAAIREVDPNHLIFGDPLNANSAPSDEVVAEIAKHTDLVAYQYYGTYDEQSSIMDRWSKLTGKALFHTDSNFSVAYEQMPAPIGPVYPDQEARARATVDFASRAFSRPDFVGWNWCGWMDSWSAWKKERQHPGLQDPFGNYQHPMPETLARFGAELYDYARERESVGVGDVR